MKWLLLAILALVGAVVVALVALPDPGYVLIGYGKYSIETSLLVLLVVLGVAYLGLRALAGLWRIPARVHHWEQRRQGRRFQLHFNAATRALTEGNYQRAERRLSRLLKSNQAPLQAYLSAATAAGQLGADQRRDRYLQLALQRQPEAESSILFQQAELQLTAGQPEQAQTTLTRLQKLLPNNPSTLKLLLQLYMQQQDWPQLRALLPKLHNHNVLEKVQWQKLAVEVYREQLQSFSLSSEIEAMTASWKQLPQTVQQDQGLVAVYIEQLMRLGGHDQAGRVLRKQLGHSWNDRLAYLFGDIQETNISAQQRQAEQWLEKRPEDPVLLLSLAKISLRNQLWGKARNYLETGLGIQPTPEAYNLLANLLEQLDEPDKAAECYRRGLALGSEPVSNALTISDDVQDIGAS